MALDRPSRRGTYHPPLRFMYTCRFDGPGVLILLVQAMLLLSAPRTGGVTHWKLTGDTITPGSLAPSVDLPEKVPSRIPGPKNEDIFAASQLTSADPEFALLIRYSTKSSRKGISPNRGGNSLGVFRRVSEDVDLDYCDSSNSEDIGDDVDIKFPGDRKSTRSKRCQQTWERKELKMPEGSSSMHSSDLDEAQIPPLTCGDPVVSMPYDFLKGISKRSEHKPYPEPEVAMIFKKSELDTTVDLFDIEVGLRKAYAENPQSITVLNQIGNFWRIKGDTQKAIECFRKALHYSSDHPDLLLNLARVLFNLKFYDDSIFLAKKSLHVKSSDNHAWLQYFTLGEVYKALEKYEEAVFYFRKSLEKNPDLRVAQMHLNELGMDNRQTTNTYTMLIIVALICIVLILIYFLVSTMNV